VGVLIVNNNYWRANDFLYKSESFFTGIYNGTTDTGESAPIWSVRFMEKRPKSKVEIIEGYGKIKEIERSSTKRMYQVETANRLRILENTLYFPGWSVLIDGRPQVIEFQDQNYRGLITFYVGKGEHLVSIIYGKTKIRKFADIISLASLIAVIGLLITKSGIKKDIIRIRKVYDRRL
jgi:hypothetical protein